MNENSMNNDVTMRPNAGASLGRIDQYELIRELGGGGFGCVYLARDTVAGIEVAVKGLPPLVRLNKEELENVRQNFALVSRLYHPNIAAALHFQKVQSAVYNDEDVKEKFRVFKDDPLVVMQYARGVTLSQWRKQFPDGKVPLDKALEITRQIASALDYAHKEKILHRDIKPANVMIETGADGLLTARVLDFGLAAEIRSSMSRVSQSITDTSGTRPYMAPEQWGGRKQGKETDLYSLAILFYELVSGEVPFASVFDTGDPVLMMNVIETKNPELSSELSKPIRLALSKAVAKKREDRFDSCTAFVDALVGRGVLTAPSGKAFGKIAAVGLLALGLAGGVWYWQSEKAKEEARIVAEQKAEAERKAELEVFRLSSKAQSAHDLIDGESSEIKEFFGSEIRAFENDRRAGDDAKANSKYVIATNFYAQALMAATALKGSVTKYHECKELLPKIERAKKRADEVNAAGSLPSGYRAAQEAQSVALAAFKAKRFDECKVKRQEAESLFASLRTDVITAVLDVADGHKNAERWDKCKQEAEKVLGWDANNAKALQLKAEAENRLVPSLKVGSGFFPVSGVTLGKTTRSQIISMGGVPTSGKYANKCVDYVDISWWDHNQDGVIEYLYAVRYGKFPVEWSSKGISWSSSYNEWLAMFKRNNFSVKITEPPHVKMYRGRKTLSADIEAVSEDERIKFELDFDYGNDKGEGFSTTSHNSLYSISVTSERD